MSKELEALKRLRQETCPATYMADFDKNECCDVIEQALNRLESIDNANPSEALETVDKILGYFGKAQVETMTLSKCNVLTIKQALLKAQEQEKENELLKEIIKRY